MNGIIAHQYTTQYENKNNCAIFVGCPANLLQWRRHGRYWSCKPAPCINPVTGFNFDDTKRNIDALEFKNAINDGREPNGSVGQILQCMELLHKIEQKLLHGKN